MYQVIYGFGIWVSFEIGYIVFGFQVVFYGCDIDFLFVIILFDIVEGYIIVDGMLIVDLYGVCFQVVIDGLGGNGVIGLDICGQFIIIVVGYIDGVFDIVVFDN